MELQAVFAVDESHTDRVLVRIWRPGA